MPISTQFQRVACWSVSGCIVVFVVNHISLSLDHTFFFLPSNVDSHSTHSFNGFGINLIDSTGKCSVYHKNEEKNNSFWFDENENKNICLCVCMITITMHRIVHRTWKFCICIVYIQFKARSWWNMVNETLCELDNVTISNQSQQTNTHPTHTRAITGTFAPNCFR